VKNDFAQDRDSRTRIALDLQAAFVNVGRSLTSLAEDGTSLAVSSGVSLRFSTAATP
jgi:hypothetical protein